MYTALASPGGAPGPAEDKKSSERVRLVGLWRLIQGYRGPGFTVGEIFRFGG